ncbi:MAG: hypothetical protein AB1758_17555 [Candidatus Eremiobacterota bacterium]
MNIQGLATRPAYPLRASATDLFAPDPPVEPMAPIPPPEPGLMDVLPATLPGLAVGAGCGWLAATYLSGWTGAGVGALLAIVPGLGVCFMAALVTEELAGNGAASAGVAGFGAMAVGVSLAALAGAAGGWTTLQAITGALTAAPLAAFIGAHRAETRHARRFEQFQSQQRTYIAARARYESDLQDYRRDRAHWESRRAAPVGGVHEAGDRLIVNGVVVKKRPGDSATSGSHP